MTLEEAKEKYPEIPVGHAKDLRGQTFGGLTPLWRINKVNAKGEAYWLCRCICGNYTIIIGKNMRQGHSLSCGCRTISHPEKTQKLGCAPGGLYKDLSGQKFNHLLVLEATSQRRRNEVVWKCRCDCGEITYVSTDPLKSGRVQSCGCLAISAGENKIAHLLLNAKMDYSKQQTFQSCRSLQTQALLRYDFFVNNNYLIEYDGEQHFKENTFFRDSLKEIQQRDAIKNQWCKDNNIPLIRIPYTHYDDLCIEDLMLETTKFRVV